LIEIAVATPTATAKPCPNDPVENSIPGKVCHSGCPPSRESNLQKVSNSSGWKYPQFARTAYKPSLFLLNTLNNLKSD